MKATQIRLTKNNFVTAVTAMLILAGQVLAEEGSDGAVSEQAEPADVLAEGESDVIEIEERRTDEAALNEDPEAQRRARAFAADDAPGEVGSDTGKMQSTTSLEAYGSAHFHVINTYGARWDFGE